MPSQPAKHVWIVALLVWAVWCYFVLTIFVPWIDRHWRIWRGAEAWVLCLLPVFGIAVWAIVRVRKEYPNS